MRSFGIWYKGEKEEDYEVSLHINLWDVMYKKEDSLKPFLDIGLDILNFRKINIIKILIPFKVDKSNIIDLTETFKKRYTASLIFNNECDINYSSSGEGVNYIDIHDEKGPRVLYKLDESFIEIPENEPITFINIDLERLKSINRYDKYNNIYMRFRIESEYLEKELFCNVKRKNWFLESAFNKTQIVDIKINKKRNIPNYYIKDIETKGFKFLGFKKIHFLVMEPVQNIVDILGNDFCECRKLEPEWVNYLKDDCDLGNTLAYHFKRSAIETSTGEKEQINEYGKMVKVTSSTTSWRLIGMYIIIVILLGMISSIFSTFILKVVS